MADIIPFPVHKARLPGFSPYKRQAAIHLLFNPRTFEQLMRSLGWKLPHHQLKLPAPPKPPALPYQPPV